MTNNNTQPPRKLVRPIEDRMIFGVCSGIANYLNVDTTVIRIGVFALTMFTGFIPGAITYVVAGSIMPEEEDLPGNPPDVQDYERPYYR
mgnify:CR=1 FL=1